MFPIKKQNYSWLQEHEKLSSSADKPCKILFLGDSLLYNVKRYEKYFSMLNFANFGLRGDKIQHLMWRVKFGLLPLCETVFILVGTNNLERDSPEKISQGIISLCNMVRSRLPNTMIVIHGLLPRDSPGSFLRRSTILVNNLLEKAISETEFHFLKPNIKWLLQNDQLNPEFYLFDNLHLVAGGYENLSISLQNFISSVSAPVFSDSLPVTDFLSFLPISTFTRFDCSKLSKKHKVLRTRVERDLRRSKKVK